jgi:hypothetical protein
MIGFRTDGQMSLLVQKNTPTGVRKTRRRYRRRYLSGENLHRRSKSPREQTLSKDRSKNACCRREISGKTQAEQSEDKSMTHDETKSLTALLAECDRVLANGSATEYDKAASQYSKRLTDALSFAPLAARAIKLTVEALLNELDNGGDAVTRYTCETALRETIKLWEESKR